MNPLVTAYMPILMDAGYTRKDAKLILTKINDCIIGGGSVYAVPGAVAPSVLGELQADPVIGTSILEGMVTTGKMVLADPDFKPFGSGMNYRLLSAIRRDKSLVGVSLNSAKDLLLVPPSPASFKSLPLVGYGFNVGGVVTSGEDIQAVVTYTPTIGTAPSLVCPSYPLT